MSITSGPMVPASAGNSRLRPSGSLTVVIFSMVVLPLDGAQPRHGLAQVRSVPVAAPADDVPQIVARQIEHLGKPLIRWTGLHVPLENQIELEEAPAALPLQPVCVDRIHHTARLTSSSLILLMARVGLRFFGHASTQFMMVWQRNRRYGSSRLSRRSEVTWSRLSAMNR